MEGELEDQKYKLIDLPDVDVFGSASVKKAIDCTCPNCDRLVAASRFAPHLEKCMGKSWNVLASVQIMCDEFRKEWEERLVLQVDALQAHAKEPISLGAQLPYQMMRMTLTGLVRRKRRSCRQSMREMEVRRMGNLNKESICKYFY